MTDAVAAAVEVQAEKCCTRCGESKPLDSFFVFTRRRPGQRDRIERMSWCKSCKHGRVRAHRARLADLGIIKPRKFYPGGKREARLQRHYGITTAQVEAQIQSQEGRCCICGVSFSTTTPNVSANVDHCHRTGLLRGVLCRQCNLGLGFFRDQIDFLERAVKYLADGGAWLDADVPSGRVIK
jgi:hypothetical protein